MNAPLSIRRLELARAMDYFLDVLKTAGATDQPRNMDQLAKGSFSALVPHDAGTEQVMRFGVGGLLATPAADSAIVREIPTTIPAIAELVAKCAQAMGDPVLWLHEPLLSEDEISVRWLMPKRVGGNLFLVAEDDNARQPGRIAESLDFALLSWHFLAFVTDGAHVADTVETLLARATMVVAGAYDGESALLWHRARDAAGLV
ncbi:MAG TPA: hypothetical protein VNT33_03640 [Telluria sp.]|nr:hypothetical protein [Telluria sp.]